MMAVATSGDALHAPGRGSPNAASDTFRLVVTGASGQLGSALVAAAHESGATVAALDRQPLPGGVRADGVLRIGGVDLEVEDDARAGMDLAALRLGGIDALVHAAGAFAFETLEGGALDTWDRLYAANLRTAVVAARAALPHLRHRGNGARLVFVGAASAARAVRGMGAYAASKAGVARLAESLADELRDAGITVNAVLPSVLDTPANRAAMPEADPRRWVTTRQLADVVLFLLSPQSQAVTGASIPVVGRCAGPA